MKKMLKDTNRTKDSRKAIIKGRSPGSVEITLVFWALIVLVAVFHDDIVLEPRRILCEIYSGR